MVLTIKPVTPDDLTAVRAALIETWHATYDSLYGAPAVHAIVARWHSVEALSSQMAAADSVFLAAYDADTIAASSFARRIEPAVVHLYRLYVHPRAQRRGVGLALMDATFSALPLTPLQRLEVEPRNAPAITFYERHGFQLRGRTGDCGGDSGRPALIYERQS